MEGEKGGMWAMPADQTAADSSSIPPQADNLTPMRVECFYETFIHQFGDDRDSMKHNTTVEVYPVQGGQAYPVPPSTGYTSTVVLCTIESLVTKSRETSS